MENRQVVEMTISQMKKSIDDYIDVYGCAPAGIYMCMCNYSLIKEEATKQGLLSYNQKSNRITLFGIDVEIAEQSHTHH
jgi:predicted glycosyl hydrolase (DUF1957 family)